jgi:hypothetical protein
VLALIVPMSSCPRPKARRGPARGLELDREAGLESIADVREAPFMARVRQSLLDAGVGDETDRARVLMRLARSAPFLVLAA